MDLYKISDWTEAALQETEHGVKLARAEIIKEYQGCLTGTGKLTYLMIYKRDGSAEFIGTEWFEGEINGKAGTCVFTHSGEFREQVAIGQFNVLSDSTTAELIGLRGQGSFNAGHGKDVDYSFDYGFGE